MNKKIPPYRVILTAITFILVLTSANTFTAFLFFVTLIWMFTPLFRKSNIVTQDDLSDNQRGEKQIGTLKNIEMNEPTTTNPKVEFEEPIYKRNNPQTNSDHLNYSRIRKLVADFVVLDFETTGLDAEENTIIQIAAVKYKNFEKVDEFFTYINPIEEIPAKITRITGITDEIVIDAPYLGEMLPKLVNFLDSETIVAHNASFDMKFLLTNVHNHNLPYKKYRVIDTLSLARKHIHTTNNHKLATLKRFLNLNHLKSHDALHDCYVTAELYKYCYEQSLVKQ